MAQYIVIIILWYNIWPFCQQSETKLIETEIKICQIFGNSSRYQTNFNNKSTAKSRVVTLKPAAELT